MLVGVLKCLFARDNANHNISICDDRGTLGVIVIIARIVPSRNISNLDFSVKIKYHSSLREMRVPNYHVSYYCLKIIELLLNVHQKILDCRE